MGRKRPTKFEWIADGVEGELVTPAEREDRKALKAQVAVAEKLVLRMAALKDGPRATLTLEEHTRDALEVLVALPRGGARKRQLFLVRGYLRDVDLDALAEEVARAEGARTEHSRADRWRGASHDGTRRTES
jgi:ribosomal 50S subunit-associated protein YjgA (DUF615 family)